MNVYDDLNSLERSLSASPEFTRFKRAAEAIDQNPSHAAMVKDFMAAQIQITTSKMLGQEPGQDLIDSFNTLYATIANVSAVNEFLLAQAQLSQIISDIQSRISAAISVDAEFLKSIDPYGLGDGR